MNITIIANGQFPTQTKVLALLGQADYIVCCDGALGKLVEWCRLSGMHPTQPVAVVGDGDSVSTAQLEDARKLFPDLHHAAIAEQDDNDLTKAVRHVMASATEKVETIDILGATGLREDHTLGNISLLAYYMDLHPDVRFRMLSDYGTLLPMKGHARFDSQAGQQISLFSLTPQVPVSVDGLRYPIQNRCIGWWWEATLNEALGDHFEVTGGMLIVYLKHTEAETR